jgi:hypothetical protein
MRFRIRESAVLIDRDVIISPAAVCSHYTEVIAAMTDDPLGDYVLLCRNSRTMETISSLEGCSFVMVSPESCSIVEEFVPVRKGFPLATLTIFKRINLFIFQTLDE